MKQTRIIFASDLHWCHLEWYGLSNRDRLDRFVSDMETEYKREPFDALLLLGDYSLDHWQWNVQGSYLKEGISNTANFVQTYMDRLKALGIEIRMIAGNHEQYGEEKWQEITGGLKRKDYLLIGDNLFILLDNYGVHLDPRVHSDGTYCGVDTEYVRDLMAQYPNTKVFLCAHHFAPEVESDDFKKLMREEHMRIQCLFSGHVHKSRLVKLNEQFGENQYLLYTGNYSYSSEKEDVLRCPWGYRELIISDEGFSSAYITPKHTYVLKDQTIELPYGKTDILEGSFRVKE